MIQVVAEKEMNKYSEVYGQQLRIHLRNALFELEDGKSQKRISSGDRTGTEFFMCKTVEY